MAGRGLETSQSSGGSSGAAWGSITGTLSAQSDLQTALNAKVPYTGATGDVNLGNYKLINYIKTTDAIAFSIALG
jgi:hypothetical protein